MPLISIFFSVGWSERSEVQQWWFYSSLVGVRYAHLTYKIIFSLKSDAFERTRHLLAIIKHRPESSKPPPSKKSPTISGGAFFNKSY